MTDMNPSSEEVGKRQKTTFSRKNRGKLGISNEVVDLRIEILR